MKTKFSIQHSVNVLVSLHIIFCSVYIVYDVLLSYNVLLP